jgi:hypothetical protein
MMQGHTELILDYGGVDDSEKEFSFTLNKEAALCSERSTTQVTSTHSQNPAIGLT